MRNIKQIKNLKGKTVIVRVDFNVPINDGKIEDDFRIRKSLPTIKFLMKKKAKIVLIAHLGKGGETLRDVGEALKEFIKVKFIPETVGILVTKSVSEMKNGEVVLLENLRNEKGEKDSDKIFAISLAKLGDLYVNEAFSVDHREDASIVLLPKLLPSYAGLQLEDEIKNLSRAFKKPKHPFLFILGGAKFSTKMPLINKYLKLADHVFIGGALANDFFKAKGYEIGMSLIDEADYDITKVLKNKKLILPIDVVVKSGDVLINKKVDEVKKDEIILDIGSETVKNLELIIKKSKFILWNGPLGKYEEGGDVATKEVLKSVLKSKAQIIIGGGDIVSVLSSLKPKSYKLKPNFFVSTGGGSTLDFLADGSLPGIKALG